MDPQADAAAVIRDCECSPTSARATAIFPPDLAVFRGHFPGNPLVPGVHQVALIAELLSRALAHYRIRVVGVDRCKWLAPVHPGVVLAIAVQWHTQEALWCADGVVRIGDVIACQCRITVTSGLSLNG